MSKMTAKSGAGLVTRMEKFVKKNGVATMAVLLGLRDTTRIKNWIARKSIPQEFQEQVKRSLVCKITVELK